MLGETALEGSPLTAHMVTAAVIGLDGTDAFLSDTFRRAPDVQIRFERTVTTGAENDASLWVAASDRETVDAAFASDPSVREFTSVAVRRDEWLYDVTFTPDTRSLRETLGESDAVVEGVYGENATWTVRLRVDSRTALSSVRDRLDADGYDVRVDRIWEVGDESGGLDGISPCHARTLHEALIAGYYEVPRETDLKELAGRLGITHQALSERLRRAHRRTAVLALTSTPRGRPREPSEAGESDI